MTCSDFFLVANAYANDTETTTAAKTGPVILGSISEFVNVSYATTEAIVNARILNAYDMYRNPLAYSIFENAERSMTPSTVSTKIILAAKKPDNINAV